MPRFYAPDAMRGVLGSVVPLHEDETTHLTRVLRLRPGATVRVFNGRGGEWLGEFESVAQKRALVKLLEPVAAAPEPRIPIALAIAVLKSDKMDDVVRDAVMLGVSAVQPLLTDRAETSGAALSRGRRIDRWQKIAVASAKQCGRAVVPPVKTAVTVGALLNEAANGARIMFVEPRPKLSLSRAQDLTTPSAATIIIGPEGGWSDGELQTAVAAGASLVTLGNLTLRADAAPLVTLTALRTLWEDL